MSDSTQRDATREASGVSDPRRAGVGGAGVGADQAAPSAGTGLTGGAEITGPGADAGVTSGSRAAGTGANLGETEATGATEEEDRAGP